MSEGNLVPRVLILGPKAEIFWGISGDIDTLLGRYWGENIIWQFNLVPRVIGFSAKL
jgi:hypothetical protein